ncbi:MAG: glutamine synthetase, partial [Promethearchaeota archaeon]
MINKMMEISKKLELDEIEYIQFMFTNLIGELKEVEFPANLWKEMGEGTGIDGSSLGFLGTEQSDLKIIPDLNTYRVSRYNKKIAIFISDIYNNNGKPYSGCSRHILKRQLKKIESKDLNFLIRPELEWYFMNKDLKPADNGTYMDTPPKDAFHHLRRSICSDLIKMQIPVKTFHHEAGPAQQEIEFIAKPALVQSDNVQIAKMLIKMHAYENDLIASFLPKPFPNEAGNGLHIHQYLERNGKNLFSEGDNEVSENLRYYIGGIQKHVDAISAILNP